ncbi:MAG: divalent-cation tolerance protein CutA [Pseudomonadota bacterium]
MSFCIVLTTFPTAELAKQAAHDLLAARLAACAQVDAAMTALYWWDGQIQQDSEVRLLLKTRRDLLNALEQRLRSLHPYQTPQFLHVKADGSADYLAWMNSVLQPPAGASISI